MGAEIILEVRCRDGAATTVGSIRALPVHAASQSPPCREASDRGDHRWFHGLVLVDLGQHHAPPVAGGPTPPPGRIRSQTPWLDRPMTSPRRGAQVRQFPALPSAGECLPPSRNRIRARRRAHLSPTNSLTNR